MGRLKAFWLGRTWRILQQLRISPELTYPRDNLLRRSTPATELPTGKFTYPDPLKVDPEMIKLGIQSSIPFAFTPSCPRF